MILQNKVKLEMLLCFLPNLEKLIDICTLQFNTTHVLKCTKVLPDPYSYLMQLFEVHSFVKDAFHQLSQLRKMEKIIFFVTNNLI